jgi:hypothetical protein
VTDQQRRARRAQADGDFEREPQAFRAGDGATYDPTADADARRRASERRFDERDQTPELDEDVASTQLDRVLGGVASGSLLAGAYGRQEAAAERDVLADPSELDRRTDDTFDRVLDRDRSEADPFDRRDTGYDTDMGLDRDIRLDQDARQDQDTRLDQDTSVDQDTDIDRDPLDPETDPDTDPGTDPETDPLRDPDIDDEPDLELDDNDDDTLPSWLVRSETFDTGVVQSLDELEDADGPFDSLSL